MNIDHMNECLHAGLHDGKALAILDTYFENMAIFTREHMTETCDRETILDLLFEDMYKTISDLPQKGES